MTAENATHVSFAILEGNLWEGSDAEGYRQAVQDALMETFPNADIRVRLFPGQGRRRAAGLTIDCDDGSFYDATCNHPLIALAKQVTDRVQPVYAE